MSNFDPAFSGHCSCGRPCYGQNTCNICDSADEIIEKEEKVLCCICEDEEVKDPEDMCGICKTDAEEAEAEMWKDIRREEDLMNE